MNFMISQNEKVQQNCSKQSDKEVAFKIKEAVSQALEEKELLHQKQISDLKQ